MLPWKRSTFDVSEKKQQPGYSASLKRDSIASLARACPDAVAEGALHRVCGMFKSKRRKVKITGEDPTYTVVYLGNAATIQSKGEGCADVAVTKIWSKSEQGKSGTRMKLTVSSQGIRMVHVDGKGRRPGHLYLLRRITYCVADPGSPRIFAWVYRHEVKHKAVMLRCHAVLVSKPEKAKAMALLLYQTSSTALAEFKRLKRRDDARRQQQLIGGQSVPFVPLRKLMNGHCGYKPPVERSRSAPKLGSITEDVVGEEEEQRALLHLSLEYEDVVGKSLEYEDAVGKALEYEDAVGKSEPWRSDGRQGFSELIGDLGELTLGNDVHLLRADLRVTRLLSGESTSSESSLGSGASDQDAVAAADDGEEGDLQEIG